MRWLIGAIYGPLVALVWIEAGVANALLILACILFLVIVLRVDVMSEWIQGWPSWFAGRRRTASNPTSSH
ncbi:MAG TPA: hypothetical protein VGS60_03265 [Actinomycetes bacterium]|jgi:hypothetical protein|nr:hypothetical protein [Actinomycetes bacterium]